MTHPAVAAAREAGFESRFVEAGGGRIHLVQHGRGAPLLLLHGWPEFWLTWRPLLERLGTRYTLLAPDLRGFGATGKWESEPSAKIGPETHARIVLALLDALGIARVGLVAHDVGAFVGQATARLAPDRHAGLFFMDCPHPGIGTRWIAPAQIAEIWYQSFNQQPFAATLVGASRATCSAYLAHFLHHWAHRTDAFAADLPVWTEVFLQPGNLEGGFDWYRSIASARQAVIEGRGSTTVPIDRPTRVLWGRHDPVLRAAWADTLPSTFRDLELGFAEASGHFPHREEPDLVAEAVDAFFARIGHRA